MAKQKTFITTLPTKILCKEGKKIVSGDPDLGYETMKRLVEAHPPKGNLNFDMSESGITLLVIGFCISQNTNATIAEVIGRYALLEKIPFTDAAIAILKYYSQHPWFTYYVYNEATNEFQFIDWKATSSGCLPPPKKAKKQ